MNIIQLAESFFVAALISYLATPFIRILAVKLNYFDHPQNNKVHAHPTPLLGGIAIFAAFMITIFTKDAALSLHTVRAILCGASLLLVIGLIDDRMGMMPEFKLLGQFLAAMLIVKAGLRIAFIPNYYLSVIVTYLWIIGITNSFNLLDNMNGLSAGIAVISASCFGVIAYMNGEVVVSILSFALAGSALGFLKHNFPKAGIFMGDSGSMVLGYVLSSIALLGNWKTHDIRTTLLIPILILGYPIFDTVLVSAIRIRQGRSIFQGGKDHSSHRLALLGLKRYRTVLIIYMICIFLGVTAIVVKMTGRNAGLWLVASAFLVMLILGVRLGFVDTRRFGRKKGVDASAR